MRTRGCFDWSGLLQRAFLTVLCVWTAGGLIEAQTVVYEANFMAPAFTVGPLAGQDGWTSLISPSANAAQIISSNGIDELEIVGPSVGLASPGFYHSSFSRSLSNYNALASGTPIVDLTANVWQEEGPTTSQATQFTFLILYDQQGNAYGTLGIDENGIVFGQDWNPTNQVVTDYSTATNGFHAVKMELNYLNRTITCFKDGFSIGTMDFNVNASNALGTVTLDVDRNSSAPVDSTFFVTNLAVMAGSTVSTSPCELEITSAGPWSSVDADGAPGPPQVGNIYELYTTFNVRGQPANPFRIEWTMANITYYFDNINVGPGTGYIWYFTWWLDLDDPIPWSVTLDPEGVAATTNLAASNASGWFTPVPPTNAVELYAPRVMHGFSSAQVAFQPGSGTLNLWELFSIPSTHGAQVALNVTGPTNAATVVTAPYGDPLFQIARTNAPAARYNDTNYFTVQLSSMRVNPDLLREVTWADLGRMTTNWTIWLQPDQAMESTNPAISNFVQQSLPPNFRATMTPYDAARALHRAVMKQFTYQTPALYEDAVGCLQYGYADCGGFAALLAAALRNVGVPARRISGFWQGDSDWHARVEFHLPGTEWILADPTEGNFADPTGTYAFFFGDVPDANEFMAGDVADAHLLPYGNPMGINASCFYWRDSSATFESFVEGSYLQPNGVLNITNVTSTSYQVFLSDAPAEGSIILQSSTNLTAWSPVATNLAGGTNITYTLSSTNANRRFYRASVFP